MGEVSTHNKGGGPDARSAAQIEADINRTRGQLASTLDELAFRVHPSTVAAQAKAKVLAAVDRTAGRAYVAASGGVEQVKAQFVDEKGSPRVERIVSAVLVVGGVALLFTAASKRRK